MKSCAVGGFFVLFLVGCGDGGSSGTSTSSSSSGGGGDPGVMVDRGPTSLALDGDVNGLFWNSQKGVLFMADDNNNRILKWTDADGISLAADLPPGQPNSAGLGQVVELPDGTLAVPRFGSGFAGDVVFAKSDGQGASCQTSIPYVVELV